MGWDQNGYLAWGRSIAVDGDVDFSNDYAFVASLRGYGPVVDAFAEWSERLYIDGVDYPINIYGMGCGFLALPFMYLGRMLCWLWSVLTGVEVSPFAAIYPIAHVSAQVFVGFLGLWACFTVMRRVFDERIALLTVLTSCAGLSLGYYLLISPAMAHAAGFGLNSILVLLALRWRRSLEEYIDAASRKTTLLSSAFGMGIILGLALMVRNTNALICMTPVCLGADLFIRRKERSVRLQVLVGIGLSLLCAGAGTAIGFLPQMIAWKFIYGSLFTNSYSGFAEFLPYPRFFFRILFGREIGLFLWTPLAFLAVFGLIVRARRRDALAIAGLVVLFAVALLYGSWSWFDLGFPYGHRGFVDYSIFFILGLAECLVIARKWTQKRKASGRGWAKGKALRFTIIVLVCWNLYQVVAFRAGLQPPSKPWAGHHLITDWSTQRMQQAWRTIPFVPEFAYRARLIVTGSDIEPEPMFFTPFTPMSTLQIEHAEK